MKNKVTLKSRVKRESRRNFPESTRKGRLRAFLVNVLCCEPNPRETPQQCFRRMTGMEPSHSAVSRWYKAWCRSRHARLEQERQIYASMAMNIARSMAL